MYKRQVYDRGNGDEEEVLKEEPLRIDLKKVEIKNIKETSLISVDDQGLETDSSLLSETPSDVKPYYLKVTTHDNKVTKLAVDKIEEVTVDGATLYLSLIHIFCPILCTWDKDIFKEFFDAIRFWYKFSSRVLFKVSTVGIVRFFKIVEGKMCIRDRAYVINEWHRVNMNE